MSKILGAQLYTVRDYAKTPEDIAKTFKRIKEIGYTTVQVSGLGPIPAAELRAIADENGLKIVITHTPYDKFVNDLDNLIKDHHTMGCGIAGLGALPVDNRSSAEGYLAFTRQFDAIAAELAKNGMKFSYHNHRFEFEKYGGKTGYEIIAENSNPENFMFTLDTFWVQAGGADPAAWIKRLSGRVEAVHLKDMMIINDQPVMAEILEGNLNWDAILPACEQAGVKWYLIERDSGPVEAFESLTISYINLKKLGFE